MSTDEQDFLKLREKQICYYHKRKVTTLDHQVSAALWSVAHKAETDQQKEPIYTLSLPTGSGKTQSSLAYCATRFNTDQNFSAGIFVTEIREAEALQKAFEELTHSDSSQLWSSLHSKEGYKKYPATGEEAQQKLGHVPTRLIDKPALRKCRVIFGTHDSLKFDIQGKRGNFTHYKGAPRSILFVDENPELGIVASVAPEDITRLEKVLIQHSPDYPGLPVLRRVVGRMLVILKEINGTTPAYSPQSFVASNEIQAFSGLDWNVLFKMFKEDKDAAELAQWAFNIIQFLREVAIGAVFLDRYNRLFVTSRLAYRPGDLPVVVLDATVDIHGLLPLMAGYEKRETLIPISYEQLDTTLFEYPKEYDYPEQLHQEGEKWQEFGKWQTEFLRKNTRPGDRILFITHKKCFTTGIIPVKLFSSRGEPTLWEGRAVYGLNWGAGLGSNAFRDCNVVIEVGQYNLPKYVLMGQCHAWSGQIALTQDLLDDAVGRPSGHDSLEPRGLYANPAVGHLLRWSRQSVLRGCARDVDENGVAKPMRYVAATDAALVMNRWAELYPGAPLPKLGDSSERKKNRPGTYGERAQRAVRFLRNNTKWPISLKEFCEATGSTRNNVSQLLQTYLVFGVLQFLDVEIKRAKEIGLPGKSFYLCKEVS